MKDIELPPLPDADVTNSTNLFGYRYSYSAIAMQAYASAAVEADRAQRVPDVAEIRRVLACVKSSVDSGIPVTDGWRILDALLASTPAPAQQELEKALEPRMSRACLDAWGRSRFTSGSQDAVHPMFFEAFSAGFKAAHHQEPPQQERKPMTDEQDRALCEAFCNAASDEYFKARPQLDSDVNRRIFYAGHRKAWLEWQTAHGIKE